MDTVQVVDAPEQTPPDQPVKYHPASAVAVKVMFVAEVKVPLHTAPQLIAAGALVTVPEPLFETTKLPSDP
jgi:hypothetical protein